MQQPQNRTEHFVQHGNVRRDLAGLDIPVAEIAPDEVVEFPGRLVELVAVERGADLRDRIVHFEKNFEIVGGMFGGRGSRRAVLTPLHLDEPGSVPELVHEVAADLASFLVEQNILALRRDQHQAEPQAVGAVPGNEVERIGRVAERLRHLPSDGVADDARKIDVPERFLVHELVSRHDHPGDPEENDVRPGNEICGWIKLLQRWWHRRPGSDWSRESCSDL